MRFRLGFCRPFNSLIFNIGLERDLEPLRTTIPPLGGAEKLSPWALPIEDGTYYRPTKGGSQKNFAPATAIFKDAFNRGLEVEHF